MDISRMSDILQLVETRLVSGKCDMKHKHLFHYILVPKARRLRIARPTPDATAREVDHNMVGPELIDPVIPTQWSKQVIAVCKAISFSGYKDGRTPKSVPTTDNVRTYVWILLSRNSFHI